MKIPAGWTPLPAQVRLRGRVHPGCQDENTRNVKITVGDSKGTLNHDEALAAVQEFFPKESQAGVLRLYYQTTGLGFEAIID